MPTHFGAPTSYRSFRQILLNWVGFPLKSLVNVAKAHFRLIFDNVATYPLDLTKTRLQIQGEANMVNGNAPNAVKQVNFSFHI